MEIAVMILVGLFAMIGSLFQVVLIGQLLFHPFLSKGKRLGWFKLWGVWHLIVLAFLAMFTDISIEMEAHQSVAFQLEEELHFFAMYLVLPLVISFLISRIYLVARKP